jgi:hypothetical protein
MVEFNGKRYKIVVDLLVEVLTGNLSDGLCPEPKLVRVKKIISSISRENGMDVLFSSALTSAVGKIENFSDLPGASVAQTTRFQITPDTNAAGYGWLISFILHFRVK